jgi:outer membrane protein OmpA-like peptidoglycan-associated protein
MAGEVKMFDRPPSVSEVQELLAAPAPVPAPRYRSIEIIGGAVKSAQINAPSPSTTQASYETTDRRQAAPASAMAPAPVEEAVASPTPTTPAQVATIQAQPWEERHQAADQTAFGFRINFRFDSAVIPAEAYEYLDTVGTVLHSDSGVAIVVEGHTDATGANAYNMRLSERRAKAVEDYLVRKHQIPESRIHAVGKGKTEPLNSNPFDPNNRRVQFARAN